MFSLKIRYALYGVIASASLITLVAQANTTDGVFGIYFRNMINTACTGTGVLTGFDDIIGSAGYGTKICTGLSVPLAGYNIYPDGGNVGIGTSTPTAKLEVAGQVKITGGSPGLNKVLTSDENGLATWSGSIVTPCVPGGTGVNNTCYGTGSLQYNSIGNNNTANGYQALYWNTTGGHNVANGYQALFSNDTGGQNVAIGYQALSYNNTAYNNTAIGNLALGSNSNGSNNTAIGNRSLNTNISGEHNVANGFYSLYHNIIGSNNVGLGSFTLYESTGDDNTAIGYNAGVNLTTGYNNIALGANTNLPSATASNQLNIGNLIYGTGLVGGLAGNVGIGVTNPTAKLEVAGNIKIGNSGVTCSATTEGQIRYNTTTHIFEGCNGTTWKGLTSDATPIVSGNTRYPGCDTDDIKLSNGQIWSACNVGSTLAGTTAASYGNFFQWGRNDNNFTLVPATLPIDWQSSQNDDSWGEMTNTNIARQGPCSAGYHVPSATEQMNMIIAIIGHDLNSGASPIEATKVLNTMKIPFSGFRYNVNGDMHSQVITAYLWSSSPSDYFGRPMNFASDGIGIGSQPRAYGMAVRCIKNTPSIPVTCTDFTYTPTQACQSDGTQTVSSVGLPAGCTGGTPVTSQNCTPISDCHPIGDCAEYSYLTASKGFNPKYIKQGLGVMATSISKLNNCSQNAGGFYNLGFTETNGYPRSFSMNSGVDSRVSVCYGNAPITLPPASNNCHSIGDCAEYSYLTASKGFNPKYIKQGLGVMATDIKELISCSQNAGGFYNLGFTETNGYPRSFSMNSGVDSRVSVCY